MTLYAREFSRFFVILRIFCVKEKQGKSVKYQQENNMKLLFFYGDNDSED